MDPPDFSVDIDDDDDDKNDDNNDNDDNDRKESFTSTKLSGAVETFDRLGVSI